MLNYEFHNIIRDEENVYCFLNGDCISHRNNDFTKTKIVSDKDIYFKELTGPLSSVSLKNKNKIFS